jgi:hypothetical protein
MRQNKVFNAPLVETVRPVLVFRQSEIVTPQVLRSLTTPLLERFVLALREASADQAARTEALIQSVSPALTPWVWTCDIDPTRETLASLRHAQSQRLKLGELMRDPRDPAQLLPVAALAVVRAGAGGSPASSSIAGKMRAPSRAGFAPLGRLIRSPLQQRTRTGASALGRTGTRADPGGSDQASMRLLPPRELELAEGDQVLFVGAQDVRALQLRTLTDPTVIEHLRSGREPPRSALFRWWASRRRD